MFKLPFLIISPAKLEQLKQDSLAAQQKVSEMVSRLKTQKGLAETILRSMAEGVLAVDHNGKITLANPAIEKIFGVIEPEILGNTVREGLRNNELADMIDETLKKERSIQKEIDIIIPIQGSFVVYAGPIKDKAGAVCVLHDITELKKLENYRSEFVANVSHELKTPLTAIKSYVETLLGGALEDKDNNRVFLEKIDKHSDNLSGLIDDILEISRLESKKGLGAFSRVDTAKVVKNALDTLAAKAKKKKIVFDAQCRENACFVMGIEDHIYRAVQNLIDNAVKYSKEGGQIDIRCQKKGDLVELSVKDNGIGIPTEHLPRLFERFYRVDRARSREMGGTGLGLSIVKHVMNIHKGNVVVESVEDQGSTFILTFPLAA